jgi:hypothetical protein
VLIYLVANSNRPVSREEIWQNMPKTPTKLTQTYKQSLGHRNVAQALGDVKEALGDGRRFLNTRRREYIQFECSSLKEIRDGPPEPERPVLPPPILPPPIVEPIRSWWKTPALRSAERFVSDLTRLIRHPIEFANDACPDTNQNPRQFIIFVVLVVGAAAFLFLLTAPRLPGTRIRFSLNLLAQIAVCLPAEALLLASLWRLVGHAPFSRLLKVCTYLLSAQLFLGGLFGLSEIVVRWSLDNAGQAPFLYTSAIETAGQVVMDLVTCSKERGFRGCIDSTQPIGLSTAMFWSRNVYQSPVFWFGLLLLLLGTSVQLVYNIAFCRACNTIAEPRRIWSWCVIPFAFLIPGLFSISFRSGMETVIGNGSCNVTISATPTLNPGLVRRIRG